MQSVLNDNDIGFGIDCESDEESEYNKCATKILQTKIQQDCEHILQKAEGLDKDLFNNVMLPFMKENERATVEITAELMEELRNSITKNEENMQKKESSEHEEKEEEIKEEDMQEAEEKEEEGKEEEEKEEEEEETEPEDGDTNLTLFETLAFKLQDHYRFISKLSSNVYSVERRQDNLTMCLKVGEKKPNHAPKRFPMELRVLSYLKNIIDISNNATEAHIGSQNLLYMHEFFVFKDMYVFATEYIPHEKQHTIQRSRKTIKKQMFQLLQGLDLLHQHNIMHRDIKLSNLVWDSDKERLVIIDFEHATWDTSKHHVYVGTRSFMAPELMNYELDNGCEPSPYSKKCDIYSTGMVFGCLLLGISEGNTQDFYPSIFRYKTKKYLKPNAYELLQALLQHDPQKRPTAKEALQFAYFAKLK